MSVFKRKGQAEYSYDFQLRGHRFTGGTGATNRAKALAVEAEARERAKTDLAAQRSAAGAPLTLARAASRYWAEVGQHHANAETTLRDLIRLQDFLGKDARLDKITDDDAARLVAWRRGQRVKGRAKASLLSAATINRSTIEPLRKLFNRARAVWRVELPDEPDWRRHKLKEAPERVREVRAAEETRIDEAIRPDYLPLVNFARASGLRLSECLLRKEEVDLAAGRIRTVGKGGKAIDHPVTSEMRAILMAEMANPTDHVFTYRAVRAGPDRARGERLPITASGLKTMWRRARAAGLPKDLRFHDLRHDFATKLLRETGNLKLVQRALHHSKVETTTRYAHVLDEDVRAGMEATSKSREKSRGGSGNAA